jgi:hypothetical protein
MERNLGLLLDLWELVCSRKGKDGARFDQGRAAVSRAPQQGACVVREAAGDTCEDKGVFNERDDEQCVDTAE